MKTAQVKGKQKESTVRCLQSFTTTVSSSAVSIRRNVYESGAYMKLELVDEELSPVAVAESRHETSSQKQSLELARYNSLAQLIQVFKPMDFVLSCPLTMPLG